MSSLTDAFRSLFTVQRGLPPRRGIAVRAAASMGVPLIVMTALGHETVGLQAAAGAFAAVYASSLQAGERVKVMATVAVGLFVCAVLGVLVAPSAVLSLIGLVVIGIGASALVFLYRLGPPGPVFFVLVYGLSSFVTRPVDGERLTDPLVYLAAVASGAVLALLFAALPLLRAEERARPRRPLAELLPGPWLGDDERTLVLRAAFVCIVGTLVTVLWLDPLRSYWTVATGITVLGLSAVRAHSLQRALHRVTGTLLGAALYFLLAPVAHFPWLLVIMIIALQVLIELTVTRNYAIALLFVTPLVLLISQVAAGVDDVAGVAVQRMVDTVIGAAIALLATVVIRRLGPRSELSD